MKKLALFFVVLVAVIFVSTPSHALFGSKRGKLKPSKEVTRAFKNGEIKPDHRYFLAGSLGKPIAIMALSNNVKTNLMFWVEVPMNSENLKIYTVRMETDTGGDDPHGSEILDKEKNIIGYWFSTARITTIKFTDKGVSIEAPEASAEYHGGGD